MQTNINVQSLTVEAALTGKREHIYHAAMLDPHTAAELSLDQIWSLVDDLIDAHGDWLPEYQDRVLGNLLTIESMKWARQFSPRPAHFLLLLQITLQFSQRSPLLHPKAAHG